MTRNVSKADFYTTLSEVKKKQEDFELKTLVHAFYFTVFEQFFNLDFEEADSCLTDTEYLSSTKSRKKGHDRGIDAVYIEDLGERKEINLFSFKFTEKIAKTQSNFPSNEVDKILTFLDCVFDKEPSPLGDINPFLSGKIDEIWDVLDSGVAYTININLCSNLLHGLELSEEKRFKAGLKKIHKNANIRYFDQSDLLSSLYTKGKEVVNARFRAIDKNFFEKSSGDIRALILEIDSKDLIRLVINDESLRSNYELENYQDLANIEICEDAFEDNVRVYLKQRPKINKAIKETALGEFAERFFFYNNGITITCKSLSFSNTRSPVITLDNLQIVNGSQTVHALYDAFIDSPLKFQSFEVLCRIYETENEILVKNIAEYTNSQNPVNTRDIRSIDSSQKKLEIELLNKGYYYERKKNQFQQYDKDKRIDAEKIGQLLLCIFHDQPSEALNKKSLIFGEKYDDVFHDNLIADQVLLCNAIHIEIEKNKKNIKSKITKGILEYDDYGFVTYATYYIIYTMKLLNTQEGITMELSNLSKILATYEEALKEILRIAKLNFPESYNELKVYKSAKLQFYIDDHFGLE